jgi:hypothetical protein
MSRQIFSSVSPTNSPTKSVPPTDRFGPCQHATAHSRIFPPALEQPRPQLEAEAAGTAARRQADAPRKTTLLLPPVDENGTMQHESNSTGSPRTALGNPPRQARSIPLGGHFSFPRRSPIIVQPSKPLVLDEATRATYVGAYDMRMTPRNARVDCSTSRWVRSSSST